MHSAHFIGICGKGMSAVAIMLKQAGWRITGSDAGFFDPVASYLKKHGQEFTTSHQAENIPKAVYYIVVGKHAKLVPESNSEVAAAFRRAKEGSTKVVSFPELLSEFLRNTTNYVVVGSYGKSTCTALLTHVLREAGRDPGYFVGAYPKQFDTNGQLGSELFVLEGDEYPSSNTDSRSKFLWYQPNSLLFTSGEHDHVNMFPTLEDYLRPYQQLFTLLPAGGTIVTCLDNPHTTEIIPDQLRLVTYSTQDTTADYYISVEAYAAETDFVVWQSSEEFMRGTTQLLGRHNIQNIAGVVAFLDSVVQLDAEAISRGIASFTGVKRRVDRTNSLSARVPVYETYGSSYAKARSGIDALRLHFPHKKIVAVFEPHTFSWRDPSMQHWYEDVFSGVDEIHILLPPSSHGKNTSEQLSGDDIETIVTSNTRAPFMLHHTADACFGAVTAVDRSEFVIMMITSGDLSGLTARLPEFYS